MLIWSLCSLVWKWHSVDTTGRHHASHWTCSWTRGGRAKRCRQRCVWKRWRDWPLCASSRGAHAYSASQDDSTPDDSKKAKAGPKAWQKERHKIQSTEHDGKDAPSRQRLPCGFPCWCEPSSAANWATERKHRFRFRIDAKTSETEEKHSRSFWHGRLFCSRHKRRQTFATSSKKKRQGPRI